MSRARVYALALATESLCLAVLDGRLHHDEVHQYLEPAHRMVWGYGTVAHEWHRGMRNTVAPTALAGLFSLARALGLDGPWGLFFARHAAMALLSLLALRAAMDHVRAQTADPALARLAGCAIALSVPWGALATRTLGESLSMVAVLLGLAALSRGRWVAVGAAAGAAFVLRYPAGLFSAALGMFALRDRRSLGRFAIGLTLPLALLAWADLRAWGSPFASVRAYATFNLVHDRARIEYGARPWWFYLACALAFAPWPMALALKGISRARRALPALACLGVYLVAMSALAHKEPRFFLTAVPLVAVALACAGEGVSRRAAMALGLLAAQSAAALVGWWASGLFQGDIARATRWVSARGDVGAVRVMNASHPGWASLRRPVPLDADPRERLAVSLRALDERPRPRAGRTYALCEGRLRAGEGARCAEALRARGFVAVSTHGRTVVFAR